MRGKEWLIKGCVTEKEALERLFEEMSDYVKLYDRSQWKWRRKPETKQHGAVWWAYARIEFT